MSDFSQGVLVRPAHLSEVADLIERLSRTFETGTFLNLLGSD